MIVTYDPLLVALSILIAICGGYTCFHLMERLTRLHGSAWKSTLVAAAIAIGGGIWAMHFVGMLALHLPVTIGYDLQQTLLSALIAVGVTAVALYLVTLRRATRSLTLLSGLLLGLGISGMHYVGMNAIRGNCIVSYGPWMVSTSVLVGIGASIMALYLGLRVRNKRKQIPAAIAMGLGIAGMHYTAMLAAAFAPSDNFVAIAAPVLDDSSMAVIITVVAFLLLGSTFLLAAPVPEAPRRELRLVAAAGAVDALAQPVETITADQPTEAEPPRRRVRVPVQLGKRRTWLDADEVVCVHADSHYTKVCSLEAEYFCGLSMSEMERKLGPLGFLRVHRSHMVNVHHIRGFNPQKENGEVVVAAAGREHLVPVSRGKLALVKATLGVPDAVALHL